MQINDNDILKKMATAMRATRKECNVSQENLALQANITRSYISKIERGLTNPTYLTLLSIANVLNVPIAKIAPDFHLEL